MGEFRSVLLSFTAFGLIAMAGCQAPSADTADKVEAEAKTDAEPEARVETVAAASFVAVPGATPETLQPVTEDDQGEANWLAGVVRFDAIANQTDEASVRMVGTAGGDPAANGLYTYLVFSTTHASKVFLLGNIIDYRIKGASPGKLDLEIDETTFESDGNLGMATRKVTVSWVNPPNLDQPDTELTPSVTVTPAQ
jgi:hypothetical protein